MHSHFRRRRRFWIQYLRKYKLQPCGFICLFTSETAVWSRWTSQTQCFTIFTFLLSNWFACAFFFRCEQQFAAFHWGVSLLEVDQKWANGIKIAIPRHTYHHDAHTLSPISYPWVPKELSEDDQISRVQGETHVGRGDGQNGHAGLIRVLELLAQLLSFSWWSRPVNTDVADILGKKVKIISTAIF